MFRSRTRSSSKNESVPTSSLSSGNASIQRPSTPIYNEPISYNEEDYHRNEMIDLQAPPNKNDLTIDAMSAVIAAAVQMSSVGGSPSSLSLGSASILQPFSKTEAATEKRRFSTRLFSWKKNQSSPTSPTSSTPTTPGLEPSSPFDSTSSIGTMDDDNSSQGSPRTSSASATSPMKTDDGRDELLYRGIQFKEIKTTLKTLVISDEARCPMPEIRIERPGFARINY